MKMAMMIRMWVRSSLVASNQALPVSLPWEDLTLHSIIYVIAVVIVIFNIIINNIQQYPKTKVSLSGSFSILFTITSVTNIDPLITIVAFLMVIK